MTRPRYRIDRGDFRGTFPTDLPGSRIVKIVGPDEFALASATDAAAVAVTLTGPHPAGINRRVLFLNNQGRVEIEAADTIAAGDVVFQAALGRCQSGSGTLRVGVAITSGVVGEPVEVVPR